MIFPLTFTKFLCLVLLRSAETSLMLWFYGNGFIEGAALFGSCKHTSQKLVILSDLGRAEQCLYPVRASRSKYNEILEINLLKKLAPMFFILCSQSLTENEAYTE